MRSIRCYALSFENVCVCVCEWERDKQTEREGQQCCMFSIASILYFFYVNKLTVTTPVLLMKGYYNGRYGQSSGKYVALPTGNDRALKDFISYKPVLVLRKRVFWIVAPCGWIEWFPKFRRCLSPPSSRLWVRLITQAMNEIRFIETS